MPSTTALCTQCKRDQPLLDNLCDPCFTLVRLRPLQSEIDRARRVIQTCEVSLYCETERLHTARGDGRRWRSDDTFWAGVRGVPARYQRTRTEVAQAHRERLGHALKQAEPKPKPKPKSQPKPTRRDAFSVEL